MSKAYIVYKSWQSCDDYSAVGVFLDEAKADEYVKENMIPREKEENQIEKCIKCTRHRTTHNDDTKYFDFETSCEFSKINTDRNGKYCENEKDYYSQSTNMYWKEEVEIIG